MRVITIALLVLLTSPGFAADNDQVLFEKLVGQWLFEVSEGDMQIKATEQYKSDGTINTFGKIFIDKALVEEYKVVSKWEVIDGYSYVEVLESTNDFLKPGLKIKDKIVTVNDEIFTFQSSDGVQTTVKRIK